MANLLVGSQEIDRLCKAMGIDSKECRRLIIDIQVGEVVKVYADVFGGFDDIAAMLETAKWTVQEDPT